MEGLECFGGFGGLGGFWRVFGGFGGFWRVWRVLERLERLRAGKRQLWKPIESHCCGLGPGVPVGEVALALGCLLGKVFGILEGFGAFAGWQTAALKAHRKSIAVALALGCLLGKLFKGKGLEGLEGFDGLNGFGLRGHERFYHSSARAVVRQDKFHTCGGPRRRPGLGEGRGRRIYNRFA